VIDGVFAAEESGPGVRFAGCWPHGGGLSLDASVCIEGHDRAGLKRLLLYCARTGTVARAERLTLPT